MSKSISSRSSGPPPTSSVSDALDTMPGSGAVIGGLHPIGHAPTSVVVGRALIAKVIPSSRDGLPGLGNVLDSIAPGEVLVIAGGASLVASTFGGLAARRARARGCGAAIIEGYARDTTEIAEVGLPVWTLGTTPRTGRGRLEVIVPEDGIEIDGVQVLSGDSVVADLTGICVIKQAFANEVLRQAQERVALDDAFEAKLADGGTFRSAQAATGAI